MKRILYSFFLLFSFSIVGCASNQIKSGYNQPIADMPQEQYKSQTGPQTGKQIKNQNDSLNGRFSKNLPKGWEGVKLAGESIRRSSTPNFTDEEFQQFVEQTGFGDFECDHNLSFGVNLPTIEEIEANRKAMEPVKYRLSKLFRH